MKKLLIIGLIAFGLKSIAQITPNPLSVISVAPLTSGTTTSSGADSNSILAMATNSFAVQVKNGSDFASSKMTSSNIAVMAISPNGGGSTYGDMSNATPRFEAQIGLTSGGNGIQYMWVSGSTTAGDWKHAINIPAGVQEFGSINNMDTNISEMIIHLNGSPLGHTLPGDSLMVVEGWSTNANNSGSQIGVAIMGVDAANGRALLLDKVGAVLAHIPTNRIAGLIPGNAELAFNTSVNLKGLAVCSPGISGFDAGNYSIVYFDFANDAFRIPKWRASVYQPSDTGWEDAFYVNPNTGDVMMGRSNTVSQLLFRVNHPDSTLITSGPTSSMVLAAFDTDTGATTFAIRLRDGNVNVNRYYSYGGAASSGLGHEFFTGGLYASQVRRMLISDDRITNSVPIHDASSHTVYGAFTNFSTAYIPTNTAPFGINSTNDMVIATRYVNTVAGGFSPQRAFVTLSIQLNAAAAGTAKATLYCENGSKTNKVSVSAGPLASLITTEQLSLLVAPGGTFYVADETSGAGASISVIGATCSYIGL